MPFQETYARQVTLPTLADYETKDRARATLAKGRLAAYWKHIVRAESFVYAVGALRLDRPAVAGVADDVRRIWEADANPPPWDLVKQFSGAVVAYVCELNGYRQVVRGTSPLKRKVGRDHWNMGQVLA